MVVIGYARLSSREQTQGKTTLEQQESRLRSAGATEIFTDLESGSKDDRPAFNQVMEMVRTRQCDEVVVTRLDRLTRSVITLRTVVKEFERNRVNLKALDDYLDYSTAAGRFQLNMLGSLAEMETDRLSERIKYGWAYRRQQVKANVPPFGYCQTPDKRYALDRTLYFEGKTRADVARELIEIYLECKSMHHTLRVMGEKYGIKRRERTPNTDFPRTKPGLRCWLTHPVLQGHTAYGKKSSTTAWDEHAEIIHDTHSGERLITSEEALIITSTMALNRQGRYRASNRYPLSGLVYCAECNHPMVVKKGGNRRNIIYYWCDYNALGQCNNRKQVRVDLVEGWLFQALCHRAEQIAEQVLEPEEVMDAPEIKDLHHKLEGLEKLGNDPILEQAKLALRQRIQRLREKANQELANIGSSRELLVNTLADPNYWNTVDTERKRELFRLFTNKIVVRNGQIIGIDLKV